MAKRRLEKSFADYLAIAISPVLIMLLVGSLVFFLLEIGYEGQYKSRLRTIMFCFVVASVLVGQISIEHGSSHARVYGLVLALVMSLVIIKLVDSFMLGALCLVGVIWWCTDKLTWDCTLIDDTHDASGEGLLQVAGMDDESDSVSDSEKSPELKASQNQDESLDETADQESVAGRSPFWKTTTLHNRAEPPSQPHAPGLWVMYFSLAALPLFGFGQLLIPAGDEARHYGFQLLSIYVAAALGLLLTTSFLGLRRYLRQRKVKMPASIAGLWVGMGAVLILVILLLCALLPRPEADYSVTAMIDRMSSEVGKASRFAFFNDDAGKDDGRRIGDAQEETGESKNEEQDDTGDSTKKGSKKARGGNSKGKGNKSGQGSKTGKQGEKGSKKGKQGSSGKDNSQQQGKGNKASSNGKEKGKKSKQQNKNDQKDQRQNKAGMQEKQDNSQQQTSSASQPDSVNPAGKLETIFKWIMYALLAAVVLYYVIRHWSHLVETLKIFWQELVSFWNDLFGKKTKNEKKRSAENSESETLVPRRPFAAFNNPFASGAAQQMQPEELVRYTFEALEAWAFEQHLERKQDQTPLEFARVVGEKISMMSKEVRQVARLYVQVAYADFSPTVGSLRPLEILWRRLGSLQ
jgi:hypothetical protein